VEVKDLQEVVEDNRVNGLKVAEDKIASLEAFFAKVKSEAPASTTASIAWPCLIHTGMT